MPQVDYGQTAKNIFANPAGPLDMLGSFKNELNDSRNNDRIEAAQQGLSGQSQAAGAFADQAQGNYGNMTGRLGSALDYQQGLMQGQNSVSALQLQQGYQQGLAGQRSLAASAAPQNSAMAQRQAAMNSGRLGYGLAGQQSLAGLQERNQAAQNYGQLGLGMRGQDVNAALGARQAAIGGYGQMGNMQPTQNWFQRNQAMTQGLGSAMMAM